jgi:hypothetical protein
VLAVSVPKIRARRPLAAEVRPRRVEHWLASLPRASARDSAERLLQALFGQNRTLLDTENRLSIMELYREPAIAAVDVLRQGLTTVSYPLSERSLELYLLMAKLLSEMANGYKIVANDISDKGKTNKSDLVLALQRATHFLGQVLVNAYQTYSTCPAGIWKELHHIYLYAENHRLLNFPVAAPDSNSPDGLCTITDSYQQIALLGACHPYGLLQDECIRLYKLFLHWQSSAQISSDVGKKDATGRFIINFNSDSPPIPLIKTKHMEMTDHLRLLKALDVLREVHSVLRNLKRDLAMGTLSSSMLKTGIDASDVDLLRRAGRLLTGVKTKRTSLRIEKDEQISVCCGVSTIHYFMNGEKRLAVAPEARDPDADEQTDTALSPHNGDVERYIDLGEPNLGVPADETGVDHTEPNFWQSRAVYQIHTCRTKNQSASGMCLHVTRPSSLQVHVGDVVAAQEPIVKKWRVGVVRWLRCLSEEAMDLGIEMLGPEARAVAIKRESPSTFFEGLLLPGNRTLKSPTSLIVSRGTNQPGEKLFVIDVDGIPRAVTPLRLMERTASFSQLLLAPPPRD